MRGRQSVEKGVCYIEGKRKHRKRRQQGKGFPIGLSASAAAPILGEVAKPLLNKIFGGKKQRKR